MGKVWRKKAKRIVFRNLPSTPLLTLMGPLVEEQRSAPLSYSPQLKVDWEMQMASGSRKLTHPTWKQEANHKERRRKPPQDTKGVKRWNKGMGRKREERDSAPRAPHSLAFRPGARARLDLGHMRGVARLWAACATADEAVAPIKVPPGDVSFPHTLTRGKNLNQIECNVCSKNPFEYQHIPDIRVLFA